MTLLLSFFGESVAKFLLFAVATLLVACSPASSVPPEREDGGTSAEDGSTGAAKVPVKFADVYPILSSKCGDCHTVYDQGTLRMATEDGAYAALVDVAARVCPGNARVAKGDAAGSFLVQTLKGPAGCNVPRMPKSRAPLSATEIAAIEAWINDGAER